MGTDTSAYTYMTANMKAALPAHLAIVNETWTSGHNVVVDGYNTNNYYHINFGWGGLYNNWYLVPDELPFSLTVIEGVIVDILKSQVNISEISGYKSDNIIVYPNPVKDKIYIKTTDGILSNLLIEMFAVTGQSVLKTSFKKDNLFIDVSGFTNGIYLLKFYNGSSYNYKKIIIN